MGIHEDNKNGKHTSGPSGGSCPECCSILKSSATNVIPVVISSKPTGKIIGV